MENRISVTICGEEYHFVAEESVAYMQKVGSYVNEKAEALIGSAHVSRSDATVLAAVNIADELFKERETSEGLRRQLKQYLDDASRAKTEASELRRELFKLQQEKDRR